MRFIFIGALDQVQALRLEDRQCVLRSGSARILLKGSPEAQEHGAISIGFDPSPLPPQASLRHIFVGSREQGLTEQGIRLRTGGDGRLGTLSLGPDGTLVLG